MRTVLLEQPGAPASVPEEDQLLTENPYALRKLAELGRGRHRMPEAAHELAARRARADVGELRVLSRQGRVVVAAVGRVGIDFAHGTPDVPRAAIPSRPGGLR